MAKTLKQIVVEVARRGGLPQPLSVVGSTVPQVQTLYGLMNELLDDLSTRPTWNQVIREKVHTAIAGADQGNIYTLTDAGFVGIVPETVFNRSLNLPISTGLSPEAWQAIQAGPGAAGPYQHMRIRQNRLLLTPDPTVGDTIAFEYQTTALIASAADPDVFQTSWLADGDTWTLPDSIPIAWLRMAYKRERGLEYAEDALRYESILATVGMKDNAPRSINMAGQNRPQAGVIVPVGNWVL